MPSAIGYHRPGGRDLPTRGYEQARDRMEDKRFYNSTPWIKLRLFKLAEQPLCEDCERQGRTTPARHVHHKIPRKLRPDLALDYDNLEALCVACHGAKEVR